MIKLGIIGTGNVSHWHLQEFNKIKNVSITAACDTDKKVLNKFCAQYKIKNSFKYIDDLLLNSDIDAIINTTKLKELITMLPKLLANKFFNENFFFK